MRVDGPRVVPRRVRRPVVIAALVAVTGCAATQPPFRVAPDGAKEFTVTMRSASFFPSHLFVDQGDHVRLVIHSYYQFAFFEFPKFNISRQIPHDAPEIVEFVAHERGWFDFRGYGFYPYYARLSLAGDIGGGGGPEHPMYGRLFVR